MLELLPDLNSEQEDETPVSYTPEERLLRSLLKRAWVRLAIDPQNKLILSLRRVTMPVHRWSRWITGRTSRLWRSWLVTPV